jgi:hypothetical protein
MTPQEIINDLLTKYPSSREFARAINEDAADIIRWRYGRCKVKARAVISICRLHKEISPHALNPEIFPADLNFIFGDY